MDSVFSKLFYFLSFLTFVLAFFGNTVFGYSGLELVSGGLALYVGADLIDGFLNYFTDD